MRCSLAYFFQQEETTFGIGIPAVFEYTKECSYG